jgi:hypothetical protein
MKAGKRTLDFGYCHGCEARTCAEFAAGRKPEVIGDYAIMRYIGVRRRRAQVILALS